MAKKKQGTSVEKRRRERDKMFRRREKEERRRSRKDDKTPGEGAPSVEIDPETGLPAVGPEEEPREDEVRQEGF